MSLVNMRARIEGKHFAFEVHDEWRRLNSDDRAVIQREPRPHLVPLDPWAERLICIESMRIIGSPSLCPGEILVEGRWRKAYRFQSITDKAVRQTLLQLDVRLRELFGGDPQYAIHDATRRRPQHVQPAGEIHLEYKPGRT